jgi:hypothetical protein
MQNQNENWGLIRSRFEMALFDSNGDLLGVEGTAGLPGAECCTLYQLGPGQRYVLDSYTSFAVKQVKSVEVRIIDDWYLWDDVKEVAATVTLVNPHVKVRSSFGFRDLHVLGRFRLDQDGPFNVLIQARVNGTNPSRLWSDRRLRAWGSRHPFRPDLLGEAARQAEARVDRGRRDHSPRVYLDRYAARLLVNPLGGPARGSRRY